MKDYLQNRFSLINIELDAKKAEMFEKYYNLLIEWNEKFNLTAITKEREVCDKHFIDSVLCESCIPKNSVLLDIGSGAGFPALPLKIVRPDLKVTMIDSVNKKVTFLKEVIKALNLENAEAIHIRSEELARSSYRDFFDVVTGRAVARLNTLCEYSLPLVKKGGIFIAYKAENVEDELKEAENAIRLLNGKFVKLLKIPLPGSDIVRSFAIISKIDKTPEKFPRGKGKERSDPL